MAECYASGVSACPHRGGLLPEEALRLVKNGSNTLFDLEVAGAFSSVISAPLFSPDTTH